MTAKSSKGWPRSPSRYERADGSTTGVISVAGLRASVLQQETAAAQVLQVAAQQIADAMAAPKVATRPDERRRNPSAQRSRTRSNACAVAGRQGRSAHGGAGTGTHRDLGPADRVDQRAGQFGLSHACNAGRHRLGGADRAPRCLPDRWQAALAGQRIHPPSRHSPRVAASAQTHPRSNRGDHLPVRTPRHPCGVHRTHRWCASQQPSTAAGPLTAVACRRSTPCAVGLRGPRRVGGVRRRSRH